jgi:uncharacterized membrane protein HdeD (DUF308 family)
MSQVPSSEMAREAAAGVARWWWMFLITGVAWIAIGIILMRFDTQSVATLGYLVGFMLIFAGIEQFVAASVAPGWKWVWILFGLFFLAGGIWAVVNPIGTAASLAASLGMLFVLIAIFWFIEAIASRRVNPLWWLTLVSAAIMLGMGIWVGSQGLLEKAITLLLFAGFWAFVQGFGDFVRAIQLRKLGRLVEPR